MSERDAVIVEAVRTPVGKKNGSLKDVHAADLSAHVLSALVERAGVDPALVNDVVWGCVNQIGQQTGNVGRYGVLAAGWPESVTAVTIDRQCGSSQQSVHFAAAGVISGQYDIAVAGGVEIMSAVPIGSPDSSEQFGKQGGPKVFERYNVVFNQGIGAEMIADQWGISRREMDEFSARSHELAGAAIDGGEFTGQIAEVPLADGTKFSVDEGLRRGTSADTLAKLKPAFKEDGKIHAGNSSQISDGSAALLVMTSEKAKSLGLTPIARVHTAVMAGDDPIKMLTGPIPATQKALKRSGLSLKDIGVFEINEAFASVPLAWLKDIGAPIAKLNPLGGAIALGHPLGGSGARIMTTLVHYMRQHGVKYGLQSMCEGGGMANATILELL
jgi:acetyl-CoA acyltransferase